MSGGRPSIKGALGLDLETDKILEDFENLQDPDLLAADIVENFGSFLERFRSICGDPD